MAASRRAKPSGGRRRGREGTAGIMPGSRVRPVPAVPRSFGSRLVVIVVAALAIRLLYALVVMADDPVSGDGREFHLLARVLADHGRYVQPFLFLLGHATVPTAEKPLLYPLVLALPDT